MTRPERAVNRQDNRLRMTMATATANLPVGPSGPLRQVYPVVPLFTRAYLNVYRNMRDGRGIVVPVGVTAPVVTGTPVTVQHNLGRIPQRIESKVNNGGATFPPRLTMTGATRTQATIIGDETMTNCFVRFE